VIDVDMIVLRGKTLRMASDWNLGVEFGARDARRGVTPRAEELALSSKYPTWFSDGYVKGFNAAKTEGLY